MLKKSLLRGWCSYCISLIATMIAALITALCGVEHLCTQDFIARMGNENVAFILQTLLMSSIGFAFGAGSIFFEVERWSFLQQGAAHLALTSAVWIIVELVCFTPVTAPVVNNFLLSAAATYAVTWSIQYFVWRAQVKKLDAQIRSRNEENKCQTQLKSKI